ncbi:hypothetical protein BDR04DRAFT_1232907 [Suillus decipiens]|nr:hypothetical protein BDR04DRAFT_1232907 [Suillus decipiens]
MMVKYFSLYSPMDGVENDDDKTLFSDAEWFGAELSRESRTLRLWLTHGVLICILLLSFTLWMGTPSTYLRYDIPSIYSPAHVAVEPVIIRFNGTLDFPSMYRGPPSPEIDAAWNRISRVGITRMTREEMLKAGTTESDLRSKAGYPERIGGGYMATLASTHLVHCVNLLRKTSWLEYYDPMDEDFQNKPATVRKHIDHCIEMLRQDIMCHADVTMITWYWVEGHTVPYPNFNTRHRCRNFEKIVDWSLEHVIHIEESEVTRFEDTVDRPKTHPPTS